MALSKIETGSLNFTPATKDGTKNLIINGAMQVWQRGTSSSSTGYNTADRWYLNLSGGSATASQGIFADGQTAVPDNPQFYMALNVTTGNDNCGWQYRREGTWQFANDVYTLSFWAKSATPRVMTVSSDSYDASANVDSAHTISPSTFTPTSSWQKFTFNITHSNMSGLGSYANADWTRISINQGSDTSSAAWKLDLAQVQLEKGSTATPFENRSYGDELARCQRYCYVITGGNDWHTYAGHAQTSTAFLWSATFPVPMRARASATFDNTNTQYIQGNNSNYGPTAFAVSAISQETMYVNTTSSGMSQGHALAILLNSDNKQIMDAEL